MIRLGRPDPAKLRDLLETCSKADPTYLEVGASRYGALPDGYRHQRYGRFLGNDELAFDRGVEALRGWQAHLGSGIGVLPSGAPLAVGTDIVIVMPIPFGHLAEPCRVLYVVEEENRFGFAYGTLPGHDERGEEAFWIERDDHGAVVARIAAFSKADSLAVKLGGPIGRWIQRSVTHRYMDAVGRYAGQ